MGRIGGFLGAALRGSSGSSMVEIVIGILLVGFAVSTVFPVALSSRMALGRSARRKAAVLHVQSLMDRIKMQVAADPIDLPNGGYLQGPGWQDACTGCSSPNCYALESGGNCIHDVTSMLSEGLRDLGGHLMYRVYPEVEGSRVLNRVEVEVDWNER